MIDIYYRPENRVVQGKLKNLKSRKTVWVDCFNPSKQEIDDVCAIAGIPKQEFKEHLLGYERPTTLETEDYSLVVFGAPIQRGNTRVSSLALFICKNQTVVTLRTAEIDALARVKREMLDKNPKYLDSSTALLQIILERIISSYFEHMERFQEHTDHIEAIVFKAPQKEAVEETFKIRKSVLLFQKALVANKEAILSIEKGNLSRLSKKDVVDFRDIREDVMQLIDSGDTQRIILTGVLDIYTSSVSNQMSEVIKKLTVVASYVLIPTLIASIYGMNFKNMPELSWQWGYPFSMGVMALSIFSVWYYFRKSKMI
ncbi:MAG: magnesium/cobalt transporter CorA [Candidatus Woesearchaeota archaeon]